MLYLRNPRQLHIGCEIRRRQYTPHINKALQRLTNLFDCVILLEDFIFRKEVKP